MPAPRWLARVNLHFTNHLLGPLAKHLPGMGVIVHTGRKSGRQYRTPVLVFRRGDRIIVALTYGSDAQWVQNVLAAGGCELETEGRVLQLSHPRLLHDEQRSNMLALVRLILGALKVSDFLEMVIANR